MNMITKFQLGTLACLLITTSSGHGEGVILTKANANQDAKYWRAVGFQKVEQYVASIKARLLDGKEITMDNSSIGEIIEIPDWSMMNASNEAQLALLTQQRDDYKKKAAQYPQIEKWVQSIVSRYDVLLGAKREGYVLAGGRWVEKNKVIEINGRAYTNTSVQAVKNGWVLIKHNGGTTSLALSEISKEALTKLKGLAPGLFTDEAMTASQTNTNSRPQEGRPESEPPGTFKAACLQYHAIDVNWNQVVAGGFQFEVGKAYQLGPIAKAIYPTAVLGTFDTETTHYLLYPSEGAGKFTNLPPGMVRGVPVGFEAVGVFEKNSSSGSGMTIPFFRCLFLSSTQTGAVMYNAKRKVENQK